MSKLTLWESHVDALNSNPEAKAKWIAALRSGGYTQISHTMCDPTIENSACCLHVLEMEVGDKPWEGGKERELPSTAFDDFVAFNGVAAESLHAVYDGFKNRYINNASKTTPDIWNDTLGLTFNQIADLLEHGELEWVGEGYE